MGSIDGEQVDPVTRSVLDVPVVRVDIGVFNVNRAVRRNFNFLAESSSDPLREGGKELPRLDPALLLLGQRCPL